AKKTLAIPNFKILTSFTGPAAPLPPFLGGAILVASCEERPMLVAWAFAASSAASVGGRPSPPLEPARKALLGTAVRATKSSTSHSTTAASTGALAQVDYQIAGPDALAGHNRVLQHPAPETKVNTGS
ncbi:MAG TPA: hypothetical protein VF086_14485, partial [Propionibacteriaceae bacterium]